MFTDTGNVSDNHIICVGAVYIDTILSIPHFPIEDEKLRAKNLTRRRGGNTANTLEVLKQLFDHDDQHSRSRVPPDLHLLSIFPAEDSLDVDFVRSSLPGVDLDSLSLFRVAYREAASSYILQNAENLSRTIISISKLPEMTEQEFISKLEALHSKGDGDPAPPWRHGTFHFEGRDPEITVACVQHLRKSPAYKDFKISVECEKPERKDIIYAAHEADIVFYSKLWAEKNGFTDPQKFLEYQIDNTRDDAILCVTWGAKGAVAVRKNSPNAKEDGRDFRDGKDEWASHSGYVPMKAGVVDDDKKVVDTIGAGDTFIAGMLFGFERNNSWNLQEQLDFASELAGRKVYQDGFSGLGAQMWR